MEGMAGPIGGRWGRGASAELNSGKQAFFCLALEAGIFSDYSEV